MSGVDAIARGIKDGDTVKVFNDKGTVVLPVYVSNRISPGITIMRHGAWFNEISPGVDNGGCQNSLTGELDYSGGVVNNPGISPVTPARGTTLCEVQLA